MSEDISHVPRRLRRFYRHNMPVPEELQHIGEKQEKNPTIFLGNNPSSSENDEEPREPWMNPAREEKPLSRREQRKMTTTSPVQSDSQGKPGLFSRIMHAGNPQPKPVDHALGLQGANQFEDKLPRSGEKILDSLAQKSNPTNSSTTANPDMASTLNELKRLAGTQGKSDGTSPVSLTSFHFTPVAGAPNPVDAKKTAPPLSTDTMTPRQRMEMRRMKTGSAGFGASEDDKPAAAPARTPESQASMPAHIRRRAGRVVAPGEEGFDSAPDEKESSASPFDDEKDSMSDLLGDNDAPKKKKSPAKKDDELEDMDLGDDEDIAPLDDEK